MNATAHAAAAAFVSGLAVTVKRAGMCDPTRTAVYGLAYGSDEQGAGWAWASVRRDMSGNVYLLTGPGPEGGATAWAQVGRMTRVNRVEWYGLPAPDGVQVVRERLACAGLRRMGLKVVSHYLDKLTPGDVLLIQASCLKCGETLTGARSIESGLGPVCGGRVKPPRSYAHIDLGAAMARRATPFAREVAYPRTRALPPPLPVRSRVHIDPNDLTTY